MTWTKKKNIQQENCKPADENQVSPDNQFKVGFGVRNFKDFIDNPEAANVYDVVKAFLYDPDPLVITVSA